MKRTRRFLRSKRYLSTYFACIWTVVIGQDGKRLGLMKRRYVKTNPRWRYILLQLDKMRCPLRVNP